MRGIILPASLAVFSSDAGRISPRMGEVKLGDFF